MPLVRRCALARFCSRWIACRASPRWLRSAPYAASSRASSGLSSTASLLGHVWQPNACVWQPNSRGADCSRPPVHQCARRLSASVLKGSVTGRIGHLHVHNSQAWAGSRMYKCNKSHRPSSHVRQLILNACGLVENVAADSRCLWAGCKPRLEWRPGSAPLAEPASMPASSHALPTLPLSEATYG